METKLSNNLINNNANTYDAIVVGVGHAGIEAGLALARLGKRVLMTSISLDNIGYLACNPSIGGTAKGHLVRELDALGGEMGICADKTLTQIKMLNASKGCAVHSLRAQVDKYKYHDRMRKTLEQCNNIDLLQAEVKELIENKVDSNDFLSNNSGNLSGKDIGNLSGKDSGNLSDNKICGSSNIVRAVVGIKTTLGEVFKAKAVVIACGVYLNSTIIVGDVIEEKGPASFCRSNYLADSLVKLGIEMRRFKTGTPARVQRDTVAISTLEPQRGEVVPYTLSEMSGKVKYAARDCYLGYTNTITHDIIRENLHLSPKYGGLIHGTGARYCPSIEDKIVRFGDKERHQFFLEPEGDGTSEMYVQGISTSLPADVQKAIYRSIKGFENVHIMRYAYAIEYECIDPMQLYPSLAFKGIEGLYFAGQINGTSGYEEAAAQGLVAGVNAARFIDRLEPMILTRENSYIGVLIDDLVTQGTNEPYRMMTSRAEYRLSLRQDNADIRLTEIGHKIGLVSAKRYKKFQAKLGEIAAARTRLGKVYSAAQLQPLFGALGETNANSISLADLIRRNNITRELLTSHLDVFNDLSVSAVEQVFIQLKYEGYLVRQERNMKELTRVEGTALDPSTDYNDIKELRIEAREKLNKVKPLSIGQASRISGVTPSDVNVLILNLARKR